MAESSFPFDSEITGGGYDRVYMAEIFRKYFARFVGNGVYAKHGNALEVIARSPEVMQVIVRSGSAFTEGAFYDNDDDLIISIPAADPVLNRIDAIVVRCDYVQRIVQVLCITGTPATSPLHYTPVRNADMYELLLAEVYVGFAVTNIKQSNITDYRPNSSVCGWVTGALQYIEATSFFEQYQKAYAEFMADMEAGFGDQITTINDWYSQVKEDISKLQYFNFDNLAVLPNTTYDLSVVGKSGSEYKDGFNETINSVSRGVKIAERLTRFPTSTTITVQTIRYANDGKTILDNTTQTITIGTGTNVSIEGFTENEYSPNS